MSSATQLSPIEHQVPNGAVTGFYKLCENCSRNVFVCPGSRFDRVLKLCCTCVQMLRTRENQVWQCIDCGSQRAWGVGVPDETRGKQLRCVRCHDVTEHLFRKVA